MSFVCEALILEDGRPLGEVMDPWQVQDYAALLAPERPHGYLGRPRGHDKSGTGGGVAIAEML